MSTPSDLELKDRVAIVTGASRGIGRAIALELARQGASIIVNYHHSAQAADEVVTTIRQMGREAIAHQADVSNPEQAKGLIQAAIDHYGRLDILVNNAGITRDTLIMTMSEEDWDRVQNVNLKGTFNCSKAAVRYMLRQRYGRIINITSVAGQMGNAGQTNYSASKAGQIGFTKALAREIAPRGITVNAISAGYVDTDIWRNVPQDIKQEMMKLIPLGRKGTPEEVAFAAAFLANERAGYITGQVLGVDGGMAMM
ncbi:MAG: 3-oxoacyl-[acyl-carrier-protein] reductase [Chloroflexota bacterium]